LFDSVQSKIAENSLLNNRGGGHTGAHRNIFKNLLVCYVCGGSMTYKGDVVSAKSKGSILRCSNSQKNNGCNVKGINYEEFETIIFKEVKELEISKIKTLENIRTRIDESDLTGLMQDIKQHGLLHAIGVWKEGEKYILAFGNRRLECCKKLGWSKIPYKILWNIKKGGINYNKYFRKYTQREY
ncbi:hypothetical protein LCGC14_2710300, partial [marine sediment metagenome]